MQHYRSEDVENSDFAKSLKRRVIYFTVRWSHIGSYLFSASPAVQAFLAVSWSWTLWYIEKLSNHFRACHGVELTENLLLLKNNIYTSWTTCALASMWCSNKRFRRERKKISLKVLHDFFILRGTVSVASDFLKQNVCEVKTSSLNQCNQYRGKCRAMQLSVQFSPQSCLCTILYLSLTLTHGPYHMRWSKNRIRKSLDTTHAW